MVGTLLTNVNIQAAEVVATDANGDEVQVVDNFLPRETYEHLWRYAANLPLVYGSRSNSNSDSHGHWNANFTSAGKNNLADVSSALDSTAELGPIKSAWSFLRECYIADGTLIRCYLNAYTYGTDGYFHIDSNRSDDRTTVIYLADQWDPDWAGETVFLDDSGNIIKAVLPKRNRAVIFPSNIRHAARSVSRKCEKLRRTVIFKTRKRGSSNFERLSSFLITNGAGDYQHRIGTLHDHLVRTFLILESRGCHEAICFGGGLHSFYGTNRYAQSLLTSTSKTKIIDEFGEEAERLAYLFSLLDRPKTLESPLEVAPESVLVEQRDKQLIRISRKEFDSLQKIEYANLQDQHSIDGYHNLCKSWRIDQLSGGFIRETI